MNTKEKFTDFYTAYHFLLRHTIFEGDYHSCLDVEVVKVDPSTGAIENDADRNTETRVWFETGPSGYQDLSLNCGGKTYEEATIKLANCVIEKYGAGQTKTKPKSRGLIW